MRYFLMLMLLWTYGGIKAQNTYYPPVNQTAFWDTVSPKSLGWCADSIAPLYQYLQNQNSKAFIVLVDGKIAMEKYFGTFTQDSFWYWASAGKTLTALLVGKAQEEGKLNISDRSADYLGSGWSSLTSAQEDAITLRHHLTMTTGLDDDVPDHFCTLKSCLVYKAPPGTRWAYHNGPYTLLDKVIENATGSTMNLYTQQTLQIKTGISGLWIKSGYNNVYFSKARNFARFGLLAQNGFKWNGNAILSDTGYIRQMVNTSQNLNLSYGYLWWLNGKTSYMVPGLQNVFPGLFMPSAPADLFSGIGKDGQFVCVSPSKKLVMVRMGNAPSGQLGDVPFLLGEQIWSRLNRVMCTTTSTTAVHTAPLSVWPNPAENQLFINYTGTARIADLSGRSVKTLTIQLNQAMDISGLKPGMYWLQTADGRVVRFVRSRD